MSEFLKEIEQATNKIDSISYRLSDLANAFKMVGNYTVGEDLEEWAWHLRQSSKSVNGAIGKDLNDRVKSAQANSASILESMIAGLTISKE